MREQLTGEKLSRDALRGAPEVVGELILDGVAAYLCGGTRPGEWPAHGQVLPPLYDSRVRRVRDEHLVIVGKKLRDDIAVVWPPTGGPMLVCVYTRGGSPTGDQLKSLFAEVGGLVTKLSQA